MVQDPEVLAFPDASKVVGTRVDLTWPRLELYGLLWQYMGNADDGAPTLRERATGWKQDGAVHRMPDALRTDENNRQSA